MLIADSLCMIDGRVGLNTVCLSDSLGKFLNQRLTDGDSACHSQIITGVLSESLCMNRMSKENRNAKNTLRKIAPRSRCLCYRRELINCNRHVLPFHLIHFVCLEKRCVQCISDVPLSTLCWGRSRKELNNDLVQIHEIQTYE